MINAGTLSNYNDQIGAFKQDRAHEYFSQGCYLSILAGLFSAVPSQLSILEPYEVFEYNKNCIFMVATGLVSLIFCLAEQDSFEMFALMAKLVTATTMALYMDMGAGWGKEITI